jgi:hypothetical protein
VEISLHDVGGQTLRVGVRHGAKECPPLLLFNGIGANIELGACPRNRVFLDDGWRV